MLRHLLFINLVLLTTIGYAQTGEVSEITQLDSVFSDTKGTFVLYDVQAKAYKMYNAQRAKEKYSVHSTSKIVWSIIGLEEGLVANESAISKWDSAKYPEKDFWPAGWNQDQTIVSALKYSVNWYYFDLMNLMTPVMIEQYLHQLDYQRDFKVDKINYFGLTFSIEKSSIEQIEFLQKLYNNEFKLSPATIAAVKKGMLQEQHDDYTFYYKTGAGDIKNDNCIGWVIGFVEKGDELYYFAMNIEDAYFNSILGKRLVITKAALKELGVF